MSDTDISKNSISINAICSEIMFSGIGALDFLNNLLISDLKNLNINTYHYSALCNQKGRIISSLWLNIHDEDNILMVCPSNMKDHLIQFFNMRKFRLKIEISETNNQLKFNLDNKSISSSKDSTASMTDENKEKYFTSLHTINLPWIDQSNTEKFIPQHVNLDQHENIMSFTKGCYPGQEIIARIKFLGKIKKRMKIITNKDKNILLENIEKLTQVSSIYMEQNTQQYQIQVIDKWTETDID